MNILETYRQAKIMANYMIEKMKNDESGEAPVKTLVMLFVVAILAGALLPTGVDTLIAGSNSSGSWTSSQTTTFDVLVIMIIIAAVILVVRMVTD